MCKFSNELAMFAERWGGDDPMVVKMLAGKSPRERAAELIRGSTLQQGRRPPASWLTAERPRSTSSKDSLIQFFQAIEPEYRQLRETQDELDEIQRQAYAQIDDAKVAVNGTSGYPDATFTLRLAFGQVKGYEEEGGEHLTPWTTVEAGHFSTKRPTRRKIPGSCRLLAQGSKADRRHRRR